MIGISYTIITNLDASKWTTQAAAPSVQQPAMRQASALPHLMVRNVFDSIKLMSCPYAILLGKRS